jgi:hypothetical protein
MKMRTTENNGQAASDGGKIKESDHDAIEMPGRDQVAVVALPHPAAVPSSGDAMGAFS